MSTSIKKITAKINIERRLTAEEGLSLFQRADLLTLGGLAGTVRKQLHPERHVTFIVDRNINYTNVCVNKCAFCAFYREAGSPEAYVLSNEQIFRKIDETIAQGGTQILMQGGVHPDLGLDYFEDLFSAIKARFTIQIHSLSPIRNLVPCPQGGFEHKRYPQPAQGSRSGLHSRGWC